MATEKEKTDREVEKLKQAAVKRAKEHKGDSTTALSATDADLIRDAIDIAFGSTDSLASTDDRIKIQKLKAEIKRLESLALRSSKDQRDVIKSLIAEYLNEITELSGPLKDSATKDAEMRCGNCKKLVTVKSPSTKCPECGKSDLHKVSKDSAAKDAKLTPEERRKSRLQEETDSFNKKQATKDGEKQKALQMQKEHIEKQKVKGFKLEEKGAYPNGSLYHWMTSPSGKSVEYAAFSDRVMRQN